ncbi:MAG TPA: signal peptidase II, partial [Acidimicrobiales bacterium]|nr:signal peptidase II [Acidimicrobiales bacterium]
AALVVAARHARSNLVAISLGLVIGGALGNLADRVLRGYHGGVVDFVDLHFWPTFNVADACISVGAVLLAGSILISGREASHTARDGPDHGEPGD